jgi:hypothetical protein
MLLWVCNDRVAGVLKASEAAVRLTVMFAKA